MLKAVGGLGSGRGQLSQTEWREAKVQFPESLYAQQASMSGAKSYMKIILKHK